MEGFNYHHLLYFRVVAREGSIARAAEQLHVSQPTISEQLRALELQIGTALFTRLGRRLVLSDAGRTALRYAEDIHSLGIEMVSALRDHPRPIQQKKLYLGVVDGIPSVLAARIASAFAADGPLVMKHGQADVLLDDATAGALDVLLTDAAPASLQSSAAKPFGVRQVAALPVSIAALPSVARRYKAHFPASLRDAPIVIPPSNTGIGRLVETWLLAKKVHPRVIAECTDAASGKLLALESRSLLVLAGEVPRELKIVSRLERLTLKVFVVNAARASAQTGAALRILRRK